MDSKRRRSVIAVIFFIFCLNPISTDQVETNDEDSDEIFNSDHNTSLCISDQYIMQSYFTTHTSLHDSEFRNFLLQQCSDKTDQNIVPGVSLLRDRNVTGEGSHRHLRTSIKLLLNHHHSQSHLVIIERLPFGVFADPFELQSLHQRKAFREVSVFGDTDLEQPFIRSNSSVVETHHWWIFALWRSVWITKSIVR